jgi:hypothetical protein
MNKEQPDLFAEGHERTVLGALMSEPKVREEILPLVKPHLFALPTHRLILSAIAELLDEGQNPVSLAVCDRLEQFETLERVGGRGVVTEISLTTATLAITQYAMGELQRLSGLRRQAEIGQRMLDGTIQPPEAILRLTELSEPGLQSSLTTRTAGEILRLKLDENDCLMGDRLMAKSQPLVVAGASGIGKSRLLLQLAVACSLGRPFCGLETRAKGLRWLLLQTENSNHRLQFDLNSLSKWSAPNWEEIDESIVIHTIESDRDAILSLADPEVRRQIDAIIQREKPDIISVDPLKDFMIGDPNSDADMGATIATLGAICRRGNPQRVIVVLHHALTGKIGAARATGFDRSSFARNSKVLHGWTRAQINVAPGSAENNETLVLTCGKNSNGKEFPAFAVRLNPQTMIYEPDDLFDINAWREEVSQQNRAKRKTVSITIVSEILETRELKKKDLVREICDESGCGRSHAYELIDEAARTKAIHFNKSAKTYAKAA